MIYCTSIIAGILKIISGFSRLNLADKKRLRVAVKISIKRHWNANITPVKGNQSCPAATNLFFGVLLYLPIAFLLSRCSTTTANIYHIINHHVRPLIIKFTVSLMRLKSNAKASLMKTILLSFNFACILRTL